MSLLAAHANCRPTPSQPKTRPRLQAKPTPTPSQLQAGLTLNQNRSILQPKQRSQTGLAIPVLGIPTQVPNWGAVGDQISNHQTPTWAGPPHLVTQGQIESFPMVFLQGPVPLSPDFQTLPHQGNNSQANHFVGDLLHLYIYTNINERKILVSCQS